MLDYKIFRVYTTHCAVCAIKFLGCASEVYNFIFCALVYFHEEPNRWCSNYYLSPYLHHVCLWYISYILLYTINVLYIPQVFVLIIGEREQANLVVQLGWFFHIHIYILYKWKNHFNEMKGVGMATYERNKCTAFHGLMA